MKKIQLIPSKFFYKSSPKKIKIIDRADYNNDRNIENDNYNIHVQESLQSTTSQIKSARGVDRADYNSEVRSARGVDRADYNSDRNLQSN